MAEDDPLSLSALLDTGGDDSALTAKIDALEKELEAERDCRREDRFVGLVIVMALIDIIVLSGESASVSVIVFIFELVVLLVIAKRMGVEQIAGILDRILSYFAKKNSD